MRILEKACATRGTAGRMCAVVLALTCFAAVPCGASVVNGSFDTGLTGWTTLGDVQGVTDAALGDSGVDYSLLYQGVALAPGTYCLDFDFLNLLSGDLPLDGSGFPDTFFASLYFIDNLANFDLAGNVFDDAVALFDLDSSGAFNVEGTLSPSPLGSDWTHFTFNFANNYAYAIPVFELFNLNTIPGDSTVRIDNVAIAECAVVPEPATLTLSAMGLIGFVAARKRKAKSQ